MIFRKPVAITENQNNNQNCKKLDVRTVFAKFSLQIAF